jgi:peptidoglycan/xylan/chitin deacetylase (PgdA/CDA1 family)
MYLPILTYHRLLAGSPTKIADPKRISVSQGQFRTHLTWLKRIGYQSVSIPEYARALRDGRSLQGRLVGITFDDGYEDVLTLGLPILQEFGFTATVFAVPSQLGGTNLWDDGEARLLTSDQYRVLMKAGISIGAHTSTHVHLPKVDATTARKEIAGSKKWLEDALGEPITTLAYPYGESTPEIEAIAKEAGFDVAFATDRAPRDHSENLFRVRRVVIFPRTNSWQLFTKVQRWYPAYQDLKRRRGDTGTR